MDREDILKKHLNELYLRGKFDKIQREVEIYCMAYRPSDKLIVKAGDGTVIARYDPVEVEAIKPKPVVEKPFLQADYRCGDGDRQRAVELLSNHLAEGRITTAEYDQRVKVVYAARTYAQLQPPFADLPGEKPTTGPVTGKLAEVAKPAMPDPGIRERGPSLPALIGYTFLAPVGAILLVLGIIRLVTFIAATVT